LSAQRIRVAQWLLDLQLSPPEALRTLTRCFRTEMSLHVLAYNLKRAMNILGTAPLLQAIRA